MVDFYIPADTCMITFPLTRHLGPRPSFWRQSTWCWGPRKAPCCTQNWQVWTHWDTRFPRGCWEVGLIRLGNAGVHTPQRGHLERWGREGPRGKLFSCLFLSWTAPSFSSSYHPSGDVPCDWEVSCSCPKERPARKWFPACFISHLLLSHLSYLTLAALGLHSPLQH